MWFYLMEQENCKENNNLLSNTIWYSDVVFEWTFSHRKSENRSKWYRTDIENRNRTKHIHRFWK